MQQKEAPDLPIESPSPEIEDNGKVRIGGVSPSFQPIKVSPRAVQDSGKVRIGGTSPAL
ncbi:MAG: hypothetical protein ACR2QF_11055 [Geminicoccaceae bacterium]